MDMSGVRCASAKLLADGIDPAKPGAAVMAALGLMGWRRGSVAEPGFHKLLGDLSPPWQLAGVGSFVTHTPGIGLQYV